MSLLFAHACNAAEPLKTIKNCVLVPTEWADGDSFLVKTPELMEFTIRLYGVDCLEWHLADATDERRLREQRRYFGITQVAKDAIQSINIAREYGGEAAKHVRSVLSKPFTIATRFADARGDGKHKRIYAFVTTPEGKDLAGELVSLGLARAFGVCHSTPDGQSKDDYSAHLDDLELSAVAARRGVWSKTNWNTLPDERRAQRADDQQLAVILGKAPVADGELIDLNHASRDELMRLPGIGEEYANRIIENRPYEKIDQILDIPRIGKGTLEKLRPYLTVGKN